MPYTVPVHRDDVFPYGKEIGMGYYDIAENTELLEYLKKKYKQGKVDILLHGYSHEYQLSENKWLAEMKWKSSSQLKEEIPKGKKHLEKLLGMNISVFVAPNNSIDKKAISVLEDLEMNYSGIIGVRDRKVNLRYIYNFIIRWGFRIVKKVQYPGIMNYGKHKELNAYTIDNYERLIYEYHICKARKVPFVIYTHYWQLNTDEKIEEYIKKMYGYENPKVRMRKIKMNSLIKVNGFYLYLTGRAGKQLLVSNAVQMALSLKYLIYIKKITKEIERGSDNNELELNEYIIKEDNLKLYDVLTDKHLNQIYKKRPNPVGEKLVQWREKFIELSLSEQLSVLTQILQLSQLTNQGADLTAIGGVKKTGVATLNKVISDKLEFKLINQSVTGLYENEIDLLTV